MTKVLEGLEALARSSKVRAITGGSLEDLYFDGGKFVPSLLGDDIMQRQPLIYTTGRLYVYQNGVYKDKGDPFVKEMCRQLLGPRFKRNRVEEVIYYIKTATYHEPEELNPDDDLINVANGLLDWRTGQLKPHTPERLSTIQIPVEYHPEAKCPRIQQFLKDVLPADAIPAMLEWAGYLLVPSTRFEKAAMLVGSGANGKSTLINLLTVFVGQENTVSIPLQELEESRWAGAELYGKLANFCADLSPRRVQSSETFKKVVSGDELFAERKNQDPFKFRPFAKLMFSANEPPGSDDVSQAFYRRWLIFHFPNKFKHGQNADENIIQRITAPEELSGLLNLALEGLRRLHRQRRFSEGASMRQAFSDYKAATNPLEAFIEDRCILGDTYRAKKPSVYDAYKQWCQEAGTKPLGRNTFYKKLEATIPGLDEYTSHGTDFYLGIGLRDM